MSSLRSDIEVRSATDADLEDIAELVDGFVAGHPAESHPRPLPRLREAYFGDAPVAHLVVATRGDRVVAMGQWTRIYDMFWSAFGGEVGWLYVRPEARGLGIPAAIVAEISRQVRRDGGELLHGGSEADAVTKLYERVAIGSAGRSCYLSAEAFHAFADLAGLAPRDIVRRLPDPALNHVPPRPR
jgi:GNAT superfamily N-acetyltransferase